MPKKQPELEVNQDWIERQIALTARHGDAELRAFILATTESLSASRTRLERLFPGRSIGNNFAILQLHMVLAKIGYGDPGQA